MWVLDMPVYHNVPQFRGCAFAVFQGEWDLHERVWNRQEEMIVILKVKCEDQMFQRHINWEILMYC